MDHNLPILIVGGGIVGLTLAQSLRKAGIPFRVFERDLSPAHNERGWGLTIKWSLADFESCLPPDMYQRLPGIQVDPQQAVADTGRFVFLDLSTAQPKYAVPPSKRLRIQRQRLRQLLSENIPIEWNKTLDSFTQTQNSILAHFGDGSTIEGSLLVGADGASSRTRRLIFAASGDPQAAELHQLPVRFMGVTMRLAPSKAKVLREIDPLLFFGSHPDTGVFLWYSTLSTPENNGSFGKGADEYYEGQLMLSWVTQAPDDEVPSTSPARVQKMKRMAHNFEARLRSVILDIPDDTTVREIKIQDWPTREWDSIRATLIGDAAHAMTMYRGEAFNHGIVDAKNLSDKIVESCKHGYDLEKLRDAVNGYELEMRERTHSAVLLSRQACLDAHDIKNLGPDSPLVSKRARIVEPGQTET